jgi:aryl sulfotransferase
MADLEGQMRAIADFLGCEIPRTAGRTILKHCSFEYMKANAANVAPLGGAIFDGGAESFSTRASTAAGATCCRPSEVAAYERTALAKLGPECAHWLATGEMTAAQSRKSFAVA